AEARRPPAARRRPRTGRRDQETGQPLRAAIFLPDLRPDAQARRSGPQTSGASVSPPRDNVSVRDRSGLGASTILRAGNPALQALGLYQPAVATKRPRAASTRA